MRSQPSRITFLALGISSALITHGCAQKTVEEPQQRTVHKIPSEPSEPSAGNPETPSTPQTDSAVAAALKAKHEFQEMLAEKLRRLDEQRRELQLKVATLTDQAKAGWAEKFADLDAKRKVAEAKLDEIRSASGEAWERLRESSQAAWQELEQALEKAAAEF
jgi:hypothetical protein